MEGMYGRDRQEQYTKPLKVSVKKKQLVADGDGLVDGGGLLDGDSLVDGDSLEVDHVNDKQLSAWKRYKRKDMRRGRPDPRVGKGLD